MKGNKGKGEKMSENISEGDQTLETVPAERKRWIPAICFDVDGTGGYNTEWNKSIGEGQILYSLIHLGNIKISERE